MLRENETTLDKSRMFSNILEGSQVLYSAHACRILLDILATSHCVDTRHDTPSAVLLQHVLQLSTLLHILCATDHVLHESVSDSQTASA